MKEKYIKLTKAKTYNVRYRVVTERKKTLKIFYRTFKTLREAIEYRERITKEVPQREKVSRHPLYSIWEGLMTRGGVWKTSNRKVIKNYTSKGIGICDTWKTFEGFLSSVPARPSKKHQLDRIDNSLGYFTENVRWVEFGTNNFNRSIPKNKTGFRGVDPHGSKFRATIAKEGIQYRQSGFDTAEEAYEFYKQKALELYGFLPKNKIAK